MDVQTTLAHISTLSVEDRLWLAEAIWDTVAPEAETAALTNAQVQELARRVKQYEASPDSAVVSWEEVRDKALARARR